MRDQALLVVSVELRSTVPLLTQVGGALTWWQQIHIDFPGETVAGYIRLDNGSMDALAPAVDWQPASQFPGYNYAPPADPTHVYALNLLTPIFHFYEQRYGIAPNRVGITRFWAPTASQDIYYDVDAHFIHWPATYEVYAQDQGNGLHEWTMAHEYAHHVQSYAYDPDPGFCPGEHHGPSFCDSIDCLKNAWDEGMADGMADYYHVEVLHRGTVIAGFCSANRSEKHEFAVADFIYNLSRRDARAFMDTWRYTSARRAFYDPRQKATTPAEFYALWNDVVPYGFVEIVDHHPGPFSIDYDYYHYIYGIDVVTGVKTDPVPEFTAGIRRISPNPASGMTRMSLWVGSGKVISLEIVSVGGRLVRKVSYTGGVVPGTTNVELKGLASGVYFVRARDSGGNVIGATRSLVVLR